MIEESQGIALARELLKKNIAVVVYDPLAMLGWEPSIPLEVGMEKTYKWIYDRMTKNAELPRLVTSLS